jgi:hypothetical protein
MKPSSSLASAAAVTDFSALGKVLSSLKEGDADYRKEAEGIFDMLNDLQKENPEEYKRFMEETLSRPPPELLNYEEVTPAPMFVVKTLNGVGKKVFINVTVHGKIDKPRPVVGTAAQVLREGDAGYSYPLAMGELRKDVDKTGGACLVCDVILNPETIEAAKKDPATKELILNVIFETFENKHKESLCRGAHIKYPNLTYKGATVHSQRIRKKGVEPGATPGLLPTKPPGEISVKEEAEAGEVLIEASATSVNRPSSNPVSSSSSKTPANTMVFTMSKKGKTPVAMVFTFELTGVKSADEVEVSVGAERLVLYAAQYEAKIQLPVKPRDNGSQADVIFVKGTGKEIKSKLVISIPC